jgi:hypothetical protein
MSASEPSPEGAEAVVIPGLTHCACGRYQLCMDGRWRRVVVAEGGEEKLLDLGRKPKPCHVCGQVLVRREMPGHD